jgi:phosphoribosyl-ATP pyrophosphohydrolase/phosphoribosyl-AMP cyclohydrolase
MALDASDIDWNKHALIPVIVQDAATRMVLMLGYANAEALKQTVETGEVHFWSRSRNELWRKGATSGNTLTVESMHLDCDSDTILITATPHGPTCHLGEQSCFGQPTDSGGIRQLWRTIKDRARDEPPGSYTASLIAQGTDAVARKIIEEAGELVLAAKNHETGGDPVRVVEEAADLTYHLLVLLAERGIDLNDVEAELDRRTSSRSR